MALSHPIWYTKISYILNALFEGVQQHNNFIGLSLALEQHTFNLLSILAKKLTFGHARLVKHKTSCNMMVFISCILHMSSQARRRHLPFCEPEPVLACNQRGQKRAPNDELIKPHFLRLSDKHIFTLNYSGKGATFTNEYIKVRYLLL